MEANGTSAWNVAAAWCDWIEKAASNLDMVEHAANVITFNDDRDQFWQPPNPGLRFR